MCPINSVLFQNSFFFWLQTFLCNNLKTRDGGVPCWAASSRWQLQGSWERLSCSNLQMVRGESRTGHGEGWRRWCHRPRDNPDWDMVSLRQGIIRSYAQQLWLEAATGVTDDTSGEGEVQHGQFESIQYSDNSSSKSPGFLWHHWSCWVNILTIQR